MEIKDRQVNDGVGEIVITHNKAIKVILLRKTSADKSSTLQQGGIGRRAPAIFHRVSPPRLQLSVNGLRLKEETSDETKEDTASTRCSDQP